MSHLFFFFFFFFLYDIFPCDILGWSHRKNGLKSFANALHNVMPLEQGIPPNKHLKNQYLPHSESKSYQINSTKSCSSRSFQQHQKHISIPPKFSAMLELNGKPSSVTTFSTDFSFQNLVFWNLFEFSVAEITYKSIAPTFWIQNLPNRFH